MLKRRAGVVLIAALATAGGTARLGAWQLGRAEEKVALQQAQQAQRALPPMAQADLARDAAAALAQQHRAVVLRGRWLAGYAVYLENRQHKGQPGFYAVAPLLLDDGSAVLVQRGWMPRDLLDRTRIVAPAPPQGGVTLQGHIAPALARLYDFAGAASGPIRQNLDVGAYARETGLPLRPWVVLQDDVAGAPADGLVRQWPLPAADVAKHYGYAFQWFALSTLIIGLYAWFQLIRPRQQATRRQRA